MLLLEVVNVHRNQEGHDLFSDGIDYCVEHLRYPNLVIQIGYCDQHHRHPDVVTQIQLSPGFKDM